MIRTECRHDELIDLLKNSDIAYAFKKKRLRYIRSASVRNEIQHMRDIFHSLWAEEDGLLRLKDPSITKESIDIILGIFGKSDEAAALFDVNSSFISINTEEFAAFIDDHIASRNARANFISIFSGGPDSILEYVRRQNAFIVRIISTMKKFDIVDIASLRIARYDMGIILEIISHLTEIEANLARDIELFERFMRDFRRLYRENATIDIIGYGEISTVMRLQKRGWENDKDDIIRDESQWIWKKMPPFPSIKEVRRFEQLYTDYYRILTEKIGISVPRQITRHFRHERYYTVYAGQERVESTSVCNIMIKSMDAANAAALLKRILKVLVDVHAFNRRDPRVSIGIDAQLSNWALVSSRGITHHVHDDDMLLYLDTSSPLIKIDGKEQINTEIFIQSAASFLRPVIRKFFLKEVVERYYDARSVMIDIIANLYKEKREDLIDLFIDLTNEYCQAQRLGVDPITRKEINAYYSNDAFIWKFYQASRKIDRFITERLLKKQYMFRIPGTIER